MQHRTVFDARSRMLKRHPPLALICLFPEPLTCVRWARLITRIKGN